MNIRKIHDNRGASNPPPKPGDIQHHVEGRVYVPKPLHPELADGDLQIVAVESPEGKLALLADCSDINMHDEFEMAYGQRASNARRIAAMWEFLKGWDVDVIEGIGALQDVGEFVKRFATLKELLKEIKYCGSGAQEWKARAVEIIELLGKVIDDEGTIEPIVRAQ